MYFSRVEQACPRPRDAVARAIGSGSARLALALVLAGTASCAHQGGRAPEGPAQRFQSDAARVGTVEYEDDLVEGRLVLQALPVESTARAPLRAKLVTYLLRPLANLSADQLRQEARDLGNTDVFDRIYDSLRDAVNLYEPVDLWGGSDGISPAERDLLARSARLVMALFGPRGAEAQSALALGVLTAIDPHDAEWTSRFDKVLDWTDQAGAAGEGGNRRSLTAVDLLQSVLGDWPAPQVADRLARLLTDRRQKFASILAKPLPGSDDARRALGDLLIAQGDEMQRAVPNVAATYLRCGRLDRAAAAIRPLAGKPGDEPELRAQIEAALSPSAGADTTLRLARRYLPRIDLLGGTASDNADLGIAYRVLQVGLGRHPDDVESLVLSAQIAKLVSSPFLAIRQLEEAQQILERSGKASSELTGRISSELLDLYFLRLRLALDPERAAPPAADEAERLRQRTSEARRRYQNAELHVTDAQIDFELGRSYVNAGLLDRAEPLLVRARSQPSDNRAEVSADLAGLFMKQGHPERASKLLRESLESMQGARGGRETIGGVEGESKLERLLGDALDQGGDRNGAERAWRTAAAGWERLMLEHLHRKNYARSAEAMFEIGRLLYVLGRHADGIQKFEEAIEQDSDRDQSYIDAVAFLVQHGEVDAALNVYRRALSRPDRNVSEYVKVYSSLWIYDLTRRAQRTPDPTAEAFLRTIDLRHPEIRPQRGAAWYRQLCAFTIGRLDYAQLLARADTSGKRAEVYFYRAMQLLSDGRGEDAHELWRKVIDTHMISFFEFEMAWRYLRAGAPTAPPSEARPATETI
jgi:tetratricopeptide (TPR) repeat protein